MIDTLDRPTIADLEIYGLPIRIINALENACCFLYVDELQGVTEQSLLSNQNLLKTKVFGPVAISHLRSSLQRWIDGTPVCTPEQCVEFNK